MLRMKLDSLNPEEALLLDCVKYFQSQKTEDSIKDKLSKVIDWDYLNSIAIHHGLKALLSHVLSSDNFRELVPEEVLNDFGKFYKINLMWNGLLYERLINIIQILNSNNIPVLAIKGPVMAMDLYGNVALREFSDLDILVDIPHIRNAKDLLISNGYELDFEMPNGVETYYELFGYYYNLLNRQDEMAVDLHWNLIPQDYSFSLDTEAIIRSSKFAVFEGEELLVIRPEYLMIYLCLHGAKHGWSQLNWILDIAQLILTKDIDWDFVIDKTRKIGSKKMVYLGIFLASEIFSIELPDKVVKEISLQKKVKLNFSKACNILFPKVRNTYAGTLEIRLFYMSLMPSLRDKFFFVHEAVFKPTYYEWSLVTLPQPLYFLYYLLRPIRLGIKYLGKLLGG